MTLSHDSLPSSCQETVPILILSDLRRILAPFPSKPYQALGHPREVSVSFSHSTTYSLLPYTITAQTLCHPVGRQSQFRHDHSFDALLSSLRSLWLVIITKHVLIIVSLFGTHLWLYILHWEELLSSLCVCTPNPVCDLSLYSYLSTHSICLLCGSLPRHYLLPQPVALANIDSINQSIHKHWIERSTGSFICGVKGCGRKTYMMLDICLGNDWIHPRSDLSVWKKIDLVCTAKRYKTVCELRRHIVSSNISQNFWSPCSGEAWEYIGDHPPTRASFLVASNMHSGTVLLLI